MSKIKESKTLSKKIYADIWKKLSGQKVNRNTLNFARDLTSAMISSNGGDTITFGNTFMQMLLGQLKDEVNIPASVQKIRSKTPTMEDILNDTLRALKDYHGYILESRMMEAEDLELGLVNKSNLNDLLNNDELHSYFADPEFFDQYVSDISEFFQQDILTNNKLKQYLDSLNYGDKTIALTLEILSKSKEEKDKEKFNNNIKEASSEYMTKKEFNDLAAKIWKEWKEEIEEDSNEETYWKRVSGLWEDNETDNNTKFNAPKKFFFKMMAEIVEDLTKYDTSSIERGNF